MVTIVNLPSSKVAQSLWQRRHTAGTYWSMASVLRIA